MCISSSAKEGSPPCGQKPQVPPETLPISRQTYRCRQRPLCAGQPPKRPQCHLLPPWVQAGLSDSPLILFCYLEYGKSHGRPLLGLVYTQTPAFTLWEAGWGPRWHRPDGCLCHQPQGRAGKPISANWACERPWVRGTRQAALGFLTQQWRADQCQESLTRPRTSDQPIHSLCVFLTRKPSHSLASHVIFTGR